MVSTEGANSKRKRQRQTTSSLAGRQLLPVIVEIPAGSILFFSALMHAGYGIWSLDEMLIRPVPSMDDMMRTSISDLLIRYQAHVARPKQHNSFKSIDPTKTVRGYNLPCETSYFHFNHRVPLPLLFPAVFTVNDEWLGEELVYDRSRFLERHEAPSLAREAEGLQSAEDVIHATHETSEQKEERQPSKRTRRVNRTKTTPTTTLTTKEKTSAHNVTPTRGIQC